MYSDETRNPEYPTEDLPEQKTYRTEDGHPSTDETPTVVGNYGKRAETLDYVTSEPQSRPTAELSNTVYLEAMKQETTLLKSSLAISNEKCNRLMQEQTKVIQTLIGSNNSLVDRLKAMIFAQIGNYQTGTVNAVADSVESNKALVADMTSCVDKLEKQQSESIAALKKSSEDLTNSLKAEIKEISDKYREMLEKAMSELTETKGELRDELRRQPVTKKETAHLLRENIDKTSRELTGYFEESLSGSVSALNSAVKRAADEAASIGKEDKRGKKLARFSAVATPICLAIVAVIAIVGLFV